MTTNKTLRVYYRERLVGPLALTPEHRAAFAYGEDWLKEGFSISPFSLPLEKQVFLPEKPYFSGLFGVFADSLPDAWGNLLLNRFLRKKGMDPDEINTLDRLAIVGDSGMGALRYRPSQDYEYRPGALNLDSMAVECGKILASQNSENLDELYYLGGTSGGARPKIMTEVDGNPWIIKFPAQKDGKEAGVMEYEYALCAKKCGITMTDVRLFPSRECGGYFGTERFDRSARDGKRVHVLTAAALLELDFIQPSLDYHSLMKLTKILTRDSRGDLENMFRRMCFNVFSHNRDDHAKNFSYLYEEREDRWRLAPAYDLTYSSTYYGEHTTTVDGNGRDPGTDELLQVGVKAGMGKRQCKQIIEEVRSLVAEMLGGYLR